MGQFKHASPDDQLGMLLESMGQRPNSMHSSRAERIATNAEDTVHTEKMRALQTTATEQYLIERIEAERQEYQRRVAPWEKQLAHLRALQPPRPLILSREEWEKMTGVNTKGAQ